MKRIRSTKYDIRICKCGRIHTIPYEKIDKALNDNKNIILACMNCGALSIIGGDYIEDFDNDLCGYEMYTNSVAEDVYCVNESLFKAGDRKALQEIFFSKGYPVPMLTGEYADVFINGEFCDTSSFNNINGLSRIYNIDILMDAVKTRNEHAKQVNMNYFISITPDDVLEELSGYYISGLDWKDTKYYKF